MLDSLNGHGGSVNEELKIKNYEYEEKSENSEVNENIRVNLINTNNTYFDSIYVRELSKSFKPEERNKIRLNLRDAFNNQKVKDGQKIRDLEKKVENGSKKAKKELTQMKALNECVKPQKPKTTFELKKIIEKDIKKIFTSKSGDEMNSKPALLPETFELFQNYPNPFNPVTKISYALPQSAKVNISIYDILGREITKLVNGEIQQPGRYIVEFNGQSYASGVYFYRIIAEGKTKYIMTRKMVMIK